MSENNGMGGTTSMIPFWLTTIDTRSLLGNNAAAQTSYSKNLPYN
jgi:hypothetical protein